MTNFLSRRTLSYTRIKNEDPDEIKHRKAQFLIYKSLQKADSQKRRSSCWRVKTTKLKLKIGRRIKRLRKSILATISFAEDGFCKQIISQFKVYQKVFQKGELKINDVLLPPAFA